MDKLKPCPFCGGEATIAGHFNNGTGNSWNIVTCTQCGVEQPTTKYYSHEQAVSEWNRRAEPENKPLTLEQLRKLDGEPVFSPQCGWGIVGFRKVGTGEQEHSKKYTVGFSYGWEWLDDVMRIGPLYANKPEDKS